MVLEIAKTNSIVTLTLNRPERRNALNRELLGAILKGVKDAEKDSEKRILILRGEGKVFSSGMDLAETQQPDPQHTLARLVADVLHALATTRLMTIALVQGAAVAGGAGLVSACDLVAVEEGTKLGYPEVKRGLVAALVSALIARQMGERQAKELLLLGDLIDAKHAKELGLVNRIVAVGELDRALDEWKGVLLANAPEALIRSKKLLANFQSRTLRQDFDLALQVHAEAKDSSEAQEGIAAFFEKRDPTWKVSD